MAFKGAPIALIFSKCYDTAFANGQGAGEVVELFDANL
jgi:hypothetical protein